MSKFAYYNEIDPYAAQWLRNLIKAGHIAPGEVDERSIADVHPDDVKEFRQHHYFAGIGIWSYALRRIGWPDDKPICSGSAPCQPFSAAGKGAGFDDERHLWPAFFHLISQSDIDTVAGEQVASPDGLAWLDLVQADMEAADFAFGAVDICAAGFGAPHIRQRTYWGATRRLADAESTRGRGWHSMDDGRSKEFGGSGSLQPKPVRLDNSSRTGLERRGDGYNAEIGRDGAFRPAAEAGEFNRLANSNSDGHGQYRISVGDAPGASEREISEWQRVWFDTPDGGTTDRLADSDSDGCGQGRIGLTSSGDDGLVGNSAAIGLADAHNAEWRPNISGGDDGDRENPRRSESPGYVGPGGIACERPGPTNGLWANADWLFCRDGKWRPVEPFLEPLVNGASSRVGRLRAYGNGLCVAQAEGFLRAFLET